jgi:hypothetical protein
MPRHSHARSLFGGLLTGSLRSRTLLACLAGSLCVASVHAEPTPANSPSPTKPAPTNPASDPTLDELLGLPSQKPADSGKPAPIDPSKSELERQLSPQEAREEFEQAVALMGQTADRLSKSQDKGLETQRLQEDIIRKLDKMIDGANRQKNKNKSKSQQQQKDKQQQQQQQQSSQKQQQGSNQSTTSGDSTPMRPGQDGALNQPPPPGAAASWGSLPPHVRDALLQGFSDRFSSMYKTLTEDYYKRLAEERKTPTGGGGAGGVGGSSR